VCPLRLRPGRSTLGEMEAQRGTRCGVEDVARVRDWLAGGPAERSAAIDVISAWRCVDDDPATPSALLTAAVASAPRFPGAQTDPLVAMVELLWATPQVVALDEVEATYLLASEPVRRALLDLLARRRDPEALVALRHILADRGWTDLLPLPAPGLLAAVLGHSQASEVVGALVALSFRPGWEAHATWLLRRLVEETELAATTLVELVDALDPMLEVLVERCDAAMAGPEPAWRDRRRVRSMVGLLERVEHPVADAPLARVQASADPVLNAWAVAAIASRGAGVPWDRVWMAAHEPASRAELMDGLDRRGLLERVFDGAGLVRSGIARAEADLVAWLARPGELGCEPDEIEHVATRRVRVGDDGDPLDRRVDEAAFHLFRFRTRAPHWAFARGWMIGAAGLYRDDATVPVGMLRVALSLFDCEDERSVEEHFDSIASALGAT